MNNFSKALLFFVSTLLVTSNSYAGNEQRLDDATILAIFDQANATDIWIGRLGMKHGHSTEVKALAKMVVTDHLAVQQMGRDLAKKHGIFPTPPTGDQSAENLAAIVGQLQSKEGTDFDTAYIKHELSFHQSVINAIRKTLLPAIENTELKELVKTVLPGFEHHLAATEKAAKKLGIAN